jgi:hypothetical protein
MDILTDIAAFDGKHTDVLESLATRLSPDQALIRDLCEIARHDDAKMRVAATWLLKRFQTNGVPFSRDQTADVLALLHDETDWEAKLHLLQMMPDFVLPADEKDTLLRVLKDKGYLGNSNKLIRAWSYNGLAHLAAQHPAFRDDVAGVLATGQNDEAASVRARIRNILKVMPWAKPS